LALAYPANISVITTAKSSELQMFLHSDCYPTNRFKTVNTSTCSATHNDYMLTLMLRHIFFAIPHNY